MKKKIYTIISVFLIILFTLNIRANASYYSNDAVVNSGDTITITLRSTENMKNFDLKLSSYNGLTYIGCSNPSDAAAVNSANGSISYATLGSGTTTLGIYTFRAPEVSAQTIYNVIFNINGVTNKSIITVNPRNNNSGGGTTTTNPATSTTPATPEKKSSVATLSNLGIKPNDFSGFKAAKDTYNTEVPYNVEKIEVYATKGHNGQTISGTGTKTLKVGENKFEVSVTAEDGTTKKTYTINVTRKPQDEDKDKDEEKTEEETPQEELPTEDPTQASFGLSELKIEGVEIDPEFQTDIYEYTIELKEDLDKLNITTLATEVGTNLEITGNENLQEGENIITIIVKGDNEEKIATYQLTVNKILPKLYEESNKEQDQKQLLNRIIAISIAVIVIIVIIITIIVKRRKNRLNNEFIPYDGLMDDEDDEDYEENIQEDYMQEEDYQEEKDDKYDNESFYDKLNKFYEEADNEKNQKGKRFK